MTCAVPASALPGNLPDHRKPGVGRSARTPVAGLRSRLWLVGAGARPGTTRPGRAAMTSEGAPARLPPGGPGSAGEVEGGAGDAVGVGAVVAAGILW